MEVAGYLSVARRWWWTLLAATATAAVAAFILVSQIAPTYEARTELLVGPYNSDTDTLGAAGRLVQTYAELVVTEPLLESAIAETGADVSVSALAARTRATANETTRFLTIQVQDTDPERARDLANSIGDEIAQLASLDTSRPEGQIQVVDPARIPTDPIAPEVPLFVAMAALVALVGALVLMTLVEYLSPRVRTKEDLVRVSDVPFLGQLDTLRKVSATGAELIDRVPNSKAAGGYRMVAAKLAFDDAGEQVRSILVVGTAADAARGQVATNLAAVVAHEGRRVVLIDADATDAQVTRIFGLEHRPGLADLGPWAQHRATDLLIPITATLQVMPRGRAEATEDDDATHVTGTLADVARGVDLVVVSSGPLHLSASALQWARACEATMVVGVRDGSRRDDVTYAVENLRLVGVEPRGAVLAVRRRSLGRRRADATRPSLPEERLPEATLTADRLPEATLTAERLPEATLTAERLPEATLSAGSGRSRSEPAALEHSAPTPAAPAASMSEPSFQAASPPTLAAPAASPPEVAALEGSAPTAPASAASMSEPSLPASPPTLAAPAATSEPDDPAGGPSEPAASEPEPPSLEPPATPATRTPRTSRSPRANRGRAPRASRGRGPAGETGA